MTWMAFPRLPAIWSRDGIKQKTEGVVSHVRSPGMKEWTADGASLLLCGCEEGEVWKDMTSSIQKQEANAGVESV